MGFDRVDVTLVTQPAEKGQVAQMYGAEACVDDRPDCLYHMTAGAWMTVSYGVPNATRWQA